MLVGWCGVGRAAAEPTPDPAASAARPDAAARVRLGALARLHPPAAPLSAAAQLGRKLFFDTRLSGSGTMSCASCHDPNRAYAPANPLPVQFGGVALRAQGLRAVPTLTYGYRIPAFSIGPDLKPDLDENPAYSASANRQRAISEGLVPQGGFDWDGRAVSQSNQAGGPLMDPREMANPSLEGLAAKLAAAPYAAEMALLFGPNVLKVPRLAVGEALFALARFQTEERSFHPYDSKFDQYLAGRLALSEPELRGKKLFDDPRKGNCSACHPDQPSQDGRRAPTFTDYQFEALGVARNASILSNRNRHFFDEGLCGPVRKDLVTQKKYCGMFKTPTLRNVATRKVFFHNGIFHSLDEVLHFYVERDIKPEKWYPRGPDGRIQKFNDMAPRERGNVDVTDAPMDRLPGDAPALNDAEIKDLIAFLNTLTDGFGASAP
jgi:cytochrome c peroxidase